jgi:hypothetical protein
MRADFFLDLLDGRHGPHARVLRQTRPEDIDIIASRSDA